MSAKRVVRGWMLVACLAACSAPAAGPRDGAPRDARANDAARDSAVTDAQRDASNPDAPSVLYARPGANVSTITTDGQALYWMEVTFSSSVIMQAPLDGNGPIIELGPTSASIGSITTDATHVYWMGSDSFVLSEDSNVRIAPKGGGEVRQIQLNGQYPVGQLALDDTHVYVASGNCQTIGRVLKTGGDVTRIDNPIPDRRGGATSIAVDDQRVYCGSGNDARIFVGDKHGASVELLFQSAQGEIGRVLGRVRHVGDLLYTIQMRRGTVELRYEVLRLPAIGGEPEVLATFEDGVGGGSISFDTAGTRMYFLTSANGEDVLASFDINTRQRTLTTLGERNWRHGVAVTATHAHWVEWTTETSFIMRAPAHGGP